MRLTKPQTHPSKRGFIASVTLGLMGLGLPLLTAQESISFSAGLKQLGDLGMPEMKGAQWIKAPDPDEELEMPLYAIQELQTSLRGNAWQLATEPPSLLAFAATEVMESDSSAAEKEETDTGPSLADKIRAYANENAPPKDEPQEPQPAEEKSLIQKDVGKIIKALRKETLAREINQGMEWGGYDDMVGSLLLFAVQIHRSGDAETADQLASALFQTIDNDTAVIDQAIHLLAEGQYQASCARLFKEGDWDTFLAELKLLLKKYPRGWKNRPGVDMLAARVAERSHPPIPKVIDGIQIDAEAHALVLRLIEKPENGASDEEVLRLAEEYGLNADEITPEQREALLRALAMGAGGGSRMQAWLLTPPEADDKASVSNQIKALGMRALPALAAAVEDETLTFHQNAGSRSYGSSDQGPEQIYQNLTRPATRGELACRLLQAVIPVQSDPYQSVSYSPPMLREMALELWRRHKNSTPIQIAALYLQEGQQNLKQTGAQFLTNHDDPAAHAAFEQAVLQAVDPLSVVPYVEQYLSNRKAKAKPFAKAYIQILKDREYDQETLQRSSMGHYIQRAGGIDKFIDTLLLKTGDISLTKLVDQALKDKSEPDPGQGETSAIMALGESLGDVDLNECMQLFAKVADRATPQQWEEIHAILLNRASQASAMAEEEGAQPETLTPETLQAWVKLSKRDTPLTLSNHQLAYMRMLGCDHIGHVSTFLIDIAAGQANISNIYQCSRLYADATEALPFSQQRVEAILKGETPKPWPQREAVSEPRSKALMNQLAELPAAELIDFASALEMDEKWVVLEFSAMHHMRAETPKNLIELNSKITTLDPVYRRDHDAEFVKTLGVSVGDPVNHELVIKIADLLLADTERYSPTSVMILRGPMELGSTIQASTPAVEDRNTSYDYNMRNIAMMMGQIEDHDAVVCIQNGRNFWMRALTDGKAEWLSPDFLGNAGQRPELSEALKEDQAFTQPIMITLMTREEAEKVTKNQYDGF